MHVEIPLPTEADTRALGARVGRRVRPGDVVLLSGGLGAGKTTLVQGLVAALDARVEVTSPTFALCHRYDTDPPVAHVDCWRMAGPAELADLALDELQEEGWVLCVEWGERLAARYGPDALAIEIADAPLGRVARCASAAGHWAAALGALAGAPSGELSC